MFKVSQCLKCKLPLPPASIKKKKKKKNRQTKSIQPLQGQVSASVLLDFKMEDVSSPM